MQTSGNEYGLTTNRNIADSHLIKNMEWGAVAYLRNSKYGRCSNNSCDGQLSVENNNYAGGKNYQKSISQTTTGNIYGVYDVEGSVRTFVMANMSKIKDNYTFSPSYDSIQFTYEGKEKYVDTYAYGSSADDQKEFNRARLGDATAEVLSTEATSGSWNNGSSNYFYGGVTPQRSWIERGSRVIFSFNADTSYGNGYISTHAVLAPLN